MTTLTTLRRLSLATIAFLALSSALYAQARSDVYFTGPDNVISVTRFEDGASAPVVNEGGTHLRGLVARDDGGGIVTLIVANKTQSGDVRAYRCPTGANLSDGNGCESLGAIAPLKEAVGVSLDTEGNIYAVNADHGGPDLLLSVPRDPSCDDETTEGCHPAGYRVDQTSVVSVPGASLLADVLVVPGANDADYGAYGAGDVLVLVDSPAPTILRYRPNDESFIDVAPGFGGASPKGMALYPPTGQLLVATEEGLILVIKPSDVGLPPSEFTSLGGQGVHLSVGFDEEADEDANESPYLVFATYTNGGRVVAFRATNEGALEEDEELGTVITNNPWGVGNATLTAAVFTSASEAPVTINLPVGHKIVFEATDEGLTRSTQPRLIPELKVRRECSGPLNDPPDDDEDTCEGQLTIDGVLRRVPDHVHGLPFEGCPDLVDGCFLVHVPESDSDAFGSTQEHEFDDARFGLDPVDAPCYVEEVKGKGKKQKVVSTPAPEQPGVFYAIDGDDPAVVEGDEYFDITTGCGSRFSRGFQFSFFLGGWSDWTPDETATFQLSQLLLAIQTGSQANGDGGLARYIGEATRGALIQEVGRAISFNSRNNTRKTLTALDSVLAIVDDPDAVFYECGLSGDDECRNAPGEVIARTESASFFVCGASKDCQRLLNTQ